MALRIQDKYKLLDPLTLSADFVCERIKRLIFCTLDKASSTDDALCKAIKVKLSSGILYVDELLKASSPLTTHPITRSVQYDYALGFFERLAAHMMKRISNERFSNGLRTGFIYSPKDKEPTEYPAVFNNSFDALCVCENYVTVVCRLLSSIASSMPETGFWSLEFEDAGNRLTDSKKDKLLGLDGAFKQQQVLNEMTREILFYK